ncbi:DUF2889 domain-containing protein [Aquabacterium sp.]|uniref:DUF2889 domain-containing protein n=1 Tax=Aquabacterium sp. TaxID=1872578 RepID=UPI002C8785C0|nr:DUF2889 domain-containing protein [Aquabacterium sp.]HSW09142.1 DUF2889 domain-containing protein [Aquabacterium sp.]
MPLLPPDCAREASHQRSISIRAYARTDGLWDIEGHLTDAWSEPITKADGMLPAGEPMHSMWLRLTVDRSATIVAVQAATDAGPYDAACGTIAPDYGQLVGVRVARGYRDTIRRLFGRTAGCTHMNELAGVMGSAALQALWHELNENADEKPFSIDGCHALKSSGPQVMRYFPRWYRPATENG